VKKTTIRRDMTKILLVITFALVMMGGASVLLSLYMERTIQQKSNIAIDAYYRLASVENEAMRLGILVGESYASNRQDEVQQAWESLPALSTSYQDATSKLAGIQLADIAAESLSVSTPGGEAESMTGAACLAKIQAIAPLVLQNAGNVLDIRVKQLEVGSDLRNARKSLSRTYRSLKVLPRAMPKAYAEAFHRSIITVLSNDTAKDLAFVGRSVWRDVEDNLPRLLQGDARAEYENIAKEYKAAWELAVAFYAAGEDFTVFNNHLKDLQAHLTALKQRNELSLQVGQNEVLMAANRFKMSMLALPIFFLAFVSILFHRLTRTIVHNLSRATKVVQGSMQSIFETSQVMTDLCKRFMESSVRQSEAVTETMTAATEINAMAHKNRDSADSAQTSVRRSQDRITIGMQSMSNLRQSSDQIAQSMGSVKELFEDTVKQFENVILIIEGIQSKSQVISDIVFQTRLLSFNASVEAARAGEHGKGFSVVAEEVGNLAQSSGQANREISAMLNSSIDDVRRIASSTREMLDASISNATRKVDDVAGIVNEACEMMQDIMNNADDFRKSMESISSASREQAFGLDEISKAIDMVHDLTLSNSEHASRASEVTAKLDEGVQACRESIAIVTEYLAVPGISNVPGSGLESKAEAKPAHKDDIEFDNVA
jgi:methyl-accepting chemotaxis protein